MTSKLIDIRKSKERVLLVVVDFKYQNEGWAPDDIKEEMKDLAAACDAEVVETIFAHINKPSAGTLISEGKIQEIVNLLTVRPVDTIIFSYDLKGSQQRNLEDTFEIKTIDRTQLILDIFAKRAASQDGKIQVELAQLEYLLPRLVGKGIELSRLGGGIGTMGPGETKLEVDRRRILKRITKLRQGLKEIEHSRSLKRQRRKMRGIPTLSLVGYTNAGKSTLLNALTSAGQVTQNALFTTLDPLSRQLILPNQQKVVISDTVGFMHNLPHHLIEAFKATLEEVKEADILLLVLDISHPRFRQYYDSVEEVLKGLEALEKPAILVLNKIDRVEDKHFLAQIKENFSNAVCVSAKTGENLKELPAKIAEMLRSSIVEIDVTIPIDRMDLVNLAHQAGEVISIKYYNDSINIRANVPTHLAGRFKIA